MLGKKRQPVSFAIACLFVFGPLLIIAGCRNTIPDHQVRMQSSPAPLDSDIEKPPSRLANAFGIGRGKSGVRQASDYRDVSPRGSDVQTASGRADGGASFKFSDADSRAVSRQSNASASASPDSMSEREKQMVLAGLADASPEVRELALRRMEALISSKPDGPTDEERFPTLARKSTNAVDANLVQPVSATSTVKKKGLPELEQFEMPDLTATAPSSNPTVETPPTPSESPTTKPAAIAGSPASPVSPEPASPSKPAESLPVDVAKSEPSAKPVPESPAQTTPAEASRSLEAASEKELLTELIARLETRLAEPATAGNDRLSEIVRLRTLLLFDGKLEQATAAVEGWTSSEQEFLNYQSLAMWNLIDPDSHPIRERRWTSALPEFRQATNHLGASTGSLLVQNLAFCTAVDGYGKVETFSNNRFTAGQQVILYSEVENFVAERLSDGYETHLRGSYRILDSAGRRVAEQILAEDQQTCNNYRRDYFLPYILHLPDRLSPGNYRFELTLEDVKGKKYGQASIPFEITKT